MGPLKSSSVNPSITGKYVGSFAAFFSAGRCPCPDGNFCGSCCCLYPPLFLRWFRHRRREGSTARRAMGDNFAEHSSVEGRGGVGGLCGASRYLISWCHLLGHPSCSFALNGTKKKNQVAHVRTLHTQDIQTRLRVHVSTGDTRKATVAKAPDSASCVRLASEVAVLE